MATGYLYHELFGWHDTGTFAGEISADPKKGLQPYSNFEHSDTKRRIHELIVVSGLINHLVRIEPRHATEKELLRVHTQRHIDFIKTQSDSRLGGDAGDLTTPFGKGGYEIATLGIGGILNMVDEICTKKIKNGYALVRPPGHHALPDFGMGYCLFANGALGIKHAQEIHGIKKVAVVDWDVHHGNGTQDIFYSDPSVLTISIHQDGLYPLKSGMRNEQGEKAGFGTSLNIPLQAGVGNKGYEKVFDDVVLPAIRKFKPEMIFVASGFDSCVYDPLGRMLLTANGYAKLTKKLMEVADEICEGKILMTHEGGYSAIYSPFCGQAVLQEMSGKYVLDDPFAGIVDTYPSHQVNLVQEQEISEAAKLVLDIP